MVSKGEHQTVPLSVLFKRESENEKIDNPELSHGEHGQSKKGEDFMMVNTHCQRALADGFTTFLVYGVGGLQGEGDGGLMLVKVYGLVVLGRTRED
ncbi:protein phosphatase [Lithospermum erythrorhizon]|uniref:Protein phosphatase n=1 Tax=Lithospermum erythrorhizon TaxID=34254 RepID=A0AAV3RSF6_LITER